MPPLAAALADDTSIPILPPVLVTNRALSMKGASTECSQWDRTRRTVHDCTLRGSCSINGGGSSMASEAYSEPQSDTDAPSGRDKSTSACSKARRRSNSERESMRSRHR